MRHSVRGKDGKFKSRKRGPYKTKTKDNAKTHLESYDLFILDKSGSMLSVLTPTISGFNEVLNNIKKSTTDNKISSYVSLVQFSSGSDYKVSYSRVAANSVPSLSTKNYHPGGVTALNDATWKAITELRDHLDALGKLNDKVNVTVYIFTDGEENASTIVTGAQVKTLIEQVRDNYKWTVTFIGAGDKATIENTATQMGIFVSNTAHYTADAAGVTGIFSKMSTARTASLSNYAGSGTTSNVGFFSNDTTSGN